MLVAFFFFFHSPQLFKHKIMSLDWNWYTVFKFKDLASAWLQDTHHSLSVNRGALNLVVNRCPSNYIARRSIFFNIISSSLWMCSQLFCLTAFIPPPNLGTVHISCPHCLQELCRKHCSHDFPLIHSELILACSLYLSWKSTWIINVMEIYWASFLSTVLKRLKRIDKDLAKFAGKSGHDFHFLNSIAYSELIHFQISKHHLWSFFKHLPLRHYHYP